MEVTKSSVGDVDIGIWRIPTSYLRALSTNIGIFFKMELLTATKYILLENTKSDNKQLKQLVLTTVLLPLVVLNSPTTQFYPVHLLKILNSIV